MQNSPSVSVLGLGYVGLVQAACLAEEGHTVIGVDRNQDRLSAVAKAQCPFAESGLEGLLERSVRSGNLKTSSSVIEAVQSSEISIICVGTPTTHCGAADLKDLLDCLDDIRTVLLVKQTHHTVIVRSTIPVGTMQKHIIPRLTSNFDLTMQRRTACLFIPEFLREGHAIKDYRHPQKVIVGCDTNDGDVSTVVEHLFGNIQAPRYFVDYAVAEMAKYTDNYWHALKVCFANEIAGLSLALGVDGKRVMQMFREDKSLNISEVYLKPGMPFGGSCLHKDVAALGHMAINLGLELPLLSSVIPSNERQLERCVLQVIETGAQTIGVLGLAFKSGTSDLRNSPSLALVERLIAEGRQLVLYDELVTSRQLQDAFLDRASICAQALTDGRIKFGSQQLIRDCELVVLCHAPKEMPVANTFQKTICLF